MLTRCPACQTIFRLSAEQLSARAGKVRCGHCFHPFNAHEHELISAAAEPALRFSPAPAPGTTELFILEDKPAAPSLAATSAALPSTSPLADRSPDFHLPEALTPAPVKLPEVVRSGRLPATAISSSPAGHATTSPSPVDLAEDKLAFAYDAERALHTDGRAPADVLISTSLRRHAPDHAADIEEEDSSPAIQGIDQNSQGQSEQSHQTPAQMSAGEEDFATNLARATDATNAAVDRSADAAQSDDPDVVHVNLSDLDARYGRPPSHRRRSTQLLLDIAIVLLGISLAGQLLYLYRGEITRQLPGLRPVLEQACRPLGCEVPLARLAKELVLESSDLESEPGKPGHFLLYFSLSNRALHEQAWPHVELTLTDARDMPVARRVLAPAEWLPKAESAPALASQRSLGTRIRFQTADLAPTGYRVYLFYP